MPQPATIQGPVSYTEGDGPKLTIPPGPCEIEIAADSVTLGWKASNGAAGSAALTRDEFERYRKDGAIQVGS